MSNENARYEALLADVRSKLAAEWEASEMLQAEFVAAADYAAYILADAERRAGVLSTWKSNFEAAENDAALRRAEADGRVRTHGG